MMLRRYCEEHDSLWFTDDKCEASTWEHESAGVNPKIKECRFIIVDLVRKPSWMTTTT